MPLSSMPGWCMDRWLTVCPDSQLAAFASASQQQCQASHGQCLPAEHDLSLA